MGVDPLVGSERVFVVWLWWRTKPLWFLTEEIKYKGTQRNCVNYTKHTFRYGASPPQPTIHFLLYISAQVTEWEKPACCELSHESKNLPLLQVAADGLLIWLRGASLKCYQLKKVKLEAENRCQVTHWQELQEDTEQSVCGRLRSRPSLTWPQQPSFFSLAKSLLRVDG